MAEVKYEILQHIGVLHEGTKNNKELNVVKWGEYEPKFDIRVWNKDHSQPGKGVTLTADEIEKLRELLSMFE